MNVNNSDLETGFDWNNSISASKQTLINNIKEMVNTIAESSREYISNAVDAEAKKIEIEFDRSGRERRLIIYDNGKGIPKKNITSVFTLDESADKKQNRPERPFIGIKGKGLFSGLKFSRKLVITTLNKDDDRESNLNLPMYEWRKRLEDEEITDLKHAAPYGINKEETNYLNRETGTIVELVGLLTEKEVEDIKKSRLKKKHKDEDAIIHRSCFSEITNEKYIRYLSKTVPVHFEDNNKFTNLKITDYAGRNISNHATGIKQKQNIINVLNLNIDKNIKDNFIETANKIPSLIYNNTELLINTLGELNPRTVARPYPKKPINPDYFRHRVIKDINGKVVGIAWFTFIGCSKGQAVGSFDVELIDFSLRLYNVRIIDKPVLEKCAYDSPRHQAKKNPASYNSYPLNGLWGEIYLFSDKIEPKTQRDEFIDNEYSAYLLKEIGNLLEDIFGEVEHWKKFQQLLFNVSKFFIGSIQSSTYCNGLSDVLSKFLYSNLISQCYSEDDWTAIKQYIKNLITDPDLQLLKDLSKETDYKFDTKLDKFMIDPRNRVKEFVNEFLLLFNSILNDVLLEKKHILVKEFEEIWRFFEKEFHKERTFLNYLISQQIDFENKRNTTIPQDWFQELMKLPIKAQEVYMKLYKPTNVKAWNDMDNSQIKVTWDDFKEEIQTPDVEKRKGRKKQVRRKFKGTEKCLIVAKYIVYRNDKEISSVVQPEYCDNDIEPDLTYTYNVQIIDYKDNKSLKSDMVTVTTKNTDSPGEVQDLQAIEIAADKISLSWSIISSPPIAQYIVFRDDDEIGLSEDSTYFDLAVEPENTYVYKIKAKAENGTEGNFSISLTVENPEVEDPGEIQGLKANTISEDLIELIWDPLDTPYVNQYIIYREGDEIGKSIEPKYSDKDLKPGNNYNYEIQAIDKFENEGTMSSSLEVTTLAVDLPEPIQNLKVESTSEKMIELQWNPLANPFVTKYIVLRDEEEIDNTKIGKFQDINVVPGQSYIYEIIAVDKFGNKSDKSSSVLGIAVEAGVKGIELILRDIVGFYGHTSKLYQTNAEFEEEVNEKIDQLLNRKIIRNGWLVEDSQTIRKCRNKLIQYGRNSSQWYIDLSRYNELSKITQLIPIDLTKITKGWADWAINFIEINNTDLKGFFETILSCIIIGENSEVIDEIVQNNSDFRDQVRIYCIDGTEKTPGLFFF